jgi:hypothetical protein
VKGELDEQPLETISRKSRDFVESLGNRPIGYNHDIMSALQQAPDYPDNLRGEKGLPFPANVD